MLSSLKTITRLSVLVVCLIVVFADSAFAASIVYGPIAAPQDPAGSGLPTSVKIIWWTDVSTSVNQAYVGTSPSGPWTFSGVDGTYGTRHEVTISGLTGESYYYFYVNSSGIVSTSAQFRMGANLLTNGSFETWHSVSGQDWGTTEPDGWHGWEIYPWTVGGGGYENHITIAMDRASGVPTPLVKHLSHRASMDEGWRRCYGGLYQEVTGLGQGNYIVSGWVAWLYSGVTSLDGHKIEIIARDGYHTPGVAPEGTVIWQQNGAVSDTAWRYVQGTVQCSSGVITIYANLRSDYPDGSSFAHFDGFRLMQEQPSVAQFSNFQSNYTLNGGSYDVTISYDTAVPCTTQLDWGATTAYGNTTPLDSGLVTHHVVQLTGVAPAAAPYHFRVRATDPGGLNEYSGDKTFDAPKVTFYNIGAAVDQNTATICSVTWNTNYATSVNKVYYRKAGTSTYGVVQADSDPTPATSHAVVIAGLDMSSSYEYHVESGGNGIVGAVSSPDRTFQTPAHAGPGFYFGFAMVGGSLLDGGDDIGPGHDWEHLMLYEHPYLTYDSLGFSSWGDCQPNDPGTGPNVYDWSKIDASIAKAVPGKARRGYYQMWGTSPAWAQAILDTPRFWEKFEEFVEAQVIHINQVWNGPVEIVFENEPNISRAPSGWHWADWYIHCLQHFYVAVHRANAVTGIDNKVIAGNLAGHSAGGYNELYARGLKNCSDILGTHPYPENIVDGVKVEDLAQMHAYMEQYGDGDKKIFITEGWGSGRSAGFDRSSPMIEPTAQEIENMWYGLAKGFDNLMTPRDHWDPSYLYGVSFFCANDNWGAGGWRRRAEPQKDGSGNIVGFIVDGYWMTPDIAPYFWNGGMYDFYGNPKDCLHLLFPGNGLVFMNPGFELRSEPPKDHTPHFWIAEQTPPSTSIYSLDDRIYRSGGTSLKLTQTASGNNGLYQLTAKRAASPGIKYRARVWCKTEDVSGVAGKFYMRFCDLNATQKSEKIWATDVVGNSDWTLMEVSATAPSYTSRIEAGCYMSGIGTVRFDDVTIAIAAQQELGTVVGYTLDENQVPVPYSIVSTSTGGCQTVSDANGYYMMTDVPSGTYDFICRKPGYVPFRAENQTVAAGKKSFVMFCMGMPKSGLNVEEVTTSAPAAGSGTPFDVTVRVKNYGQYPVDISDVGLFIESGQNDVTGRFTIHADPNNPRSIAQYTDAQFTFSVTPRATAEGLDVSINAYAFGQEDRPNMISNGGFTATPWDYHWSFSGASGVVWSQDASTYYSAPYSVKCTVNTSGSYTYNWAYNYSAYGPNAIPARPGTNYTLGCYHKDSNTTKNLSANLFINEHYYDGSRYYYNGRRFAGVPKRQTWAHDCIIYKTGDPNETPGLYPTNRITVSMGPCTNDQPASGTTWWDDVYLKETGDWLADDRATNGVTVSIERGASLGDAFTQAPGTTVTVTNLIVTAGSESFADRLYVEESDRSAGALIQLASGAMPAQSSRVSITGKVGDVDGERAIVDAVVTVDGTAVVPAPLASAGKSFGAGVTNKGLLMRTWGRVTSIAPGNSYFLIDDGSGDLKVDCSGVVGVITPPSEGAFVIVTGISSCESGGTVPVIRPRSQGDIW